MDFKVGDKVVLREDDSNYKLKDYYKIVYIIEEINLVTTVCHVKPISSNSYILRRSWYAKRFVRLYNLDVKDISHNIKDIFKRNNYA